MTLQQLKNHPHIREHWPYCERPILDWLTARLESGALNTKSRQTEEKALRQLGQQSECAAIKKELKTLTSDEPDKKGLGMKPLNQFSKKPQVQANTP